MTTAARPGSAPVDESWPMVEEAVFRLFEQVEAKSADGHITIGPLLADLGWADIEAEYPKESHALLFRAQGRALAQTDCLDRIMLAELASVIGEQAQRVVLPGLGDGQTPASQGDEVAGIILGPLDGVEACRIAVPVAEPTGAVSMAVVAADQLSGTTLDTFDKSLVLTHVRGAWDGSRVDASAEWARALDAAQRALATELIALADAAVRLAVEHVSVREQFGAPIGSFQAPRHLLADAAASIEGARSLSALSWQRGGRLTARTAKAAAGRAHRAASDAALQVCGAIGLTAEHQLHRYVARGFQLDALCGSFTGLHAVLAAGLFDAGTSNDPLPSITSWD